MKAEKEIRDLLYEYEWYYNNNMIIETPETKGFMEALKWVLNEE